MYGNILFAEGSGMGGTITTILMIGLVVVVFFFMFRSQKKQEKEANEMRNNLQIGDEITTIGGIIGEIVRIKDETVTIETGKDRTKIRILRSAIRSVDVHATDKYGTAPATEEQPKEIKVEGVKASKKKKKKSKNEVAEDIVVEQPTDVAEEPKEENAENQTENK